MDEQHVRDLVGDILIAGFHDTDVDEQSRRLIEHHRVKNIILFSRNVVSTAQVRKLTDDLQSLAKSAGHSQPLIVSADQENGIVRRLGSSVPGLPGNMAIGAARSSELARQVGQMTALQLRYAGLNMNLAPVLDINNNPANPVIGVRSFGEEPELVAQLGIAMVEGLQSKGVIACGKHFPGHGDTAVDSHLDLPIVKHARARLERVELVPFVGAIKANIDSLMSAHIVFPEVEPDGVPATMSKRVLTGFLREELGYTGVVTTDCLEMNAISEGVGVGQGAVAALLAGADMIMVSHRLDRQEDAIESIVAAVMSDRVPYERLAEAAGRIRALKAKRLEGAGEPDIPFEALNESAIRLQKTVSDAAATVVRDSQAILPVDPARTRRIVVLVDPKGQHMSASDTQDGSRWLGEAVERSFVESEVVVKTLDDAQAIDLDSLLGDAKDSLVVVGLNASAEPYIDQLQALEARGVPTVVVALQSPYVLRQVPATFAQLAMYEHTPWMIDAVVRAMISGNAAGKLPVTIA